MSSADELEIIGHDLANGRLTTGYTRACAIIRELEEQIEQMRDAHGKLCEDLNKATDRIVTLEAELAAEAERGVSAGAWAEAIQAERDQLKARVAALERGSEIVEELASERTSKYVCNCPLRLWINLDRIQQLKDEAAKKGGQGG
jgi:chromosome segregation ATPase